MSRRTPFFTYARYTPTWEFSTLPMFPQYCRFTPTDFVPAFGLPHSSITRVPFFPISRHPESRIQFRRARVSQGDCDKKWLNAWLFLSLQLSEIEVILHLSGFVTRPLTYSKARFQQLCVFVEKHFFSDVWLKRTENRSIWLSIHETNVFSSSLVVLWAHECYILLYYI